MTRRWILPAAAAAALAAAALSVPRPALSAPEAASWHGDTVHSFVLFKIKHLGTSFVHGRFDDFKVSLKAAEGTGEISSVSFTVKADSVDTGNAKRDQHLKSPDFLNAKQFEEISFQSTGVKAVDRSTAEVAGDLTLHGVKKPVTVKVATVGTGKGMKGESLAGYEAEFTVKRSDFGMSNMVGPVGDDVMLTVAVEATKE